jgi:hypothetical protein
VQNLPFLSSDCQLFVLLSFVIVVFYHHCHGVATEQESNKFVTAWLMVLVQQRGI